MTARASEVDYTPKRISLLQCAVAHGAPLNAEEFAFHMGLPKYWVQLYIADCKRLGLLKTVGSKVSAVTGLMQNTHVPTELGRLAVQ